MARPLIAIPSRFAASTSALRYAAEVSARELVAAVYAAGGEPLQVHPDDATAARHGLPNGKTEAWHILHAEPGARVYVGTAPGVTCRRLLDRERRGLNPGAIGQRRLELLGVLGLGGVAVTIRSAHRLRSRASTTKH